MLKMLLWGGGGNCPYDSIALSPNIKVDITIDTNALGIVNVKKFYALIELKDKYDYIVILDSECVIIKEVDVFALCEKFYTDKILYGNETLPNSTFFNVNNIYNISRRYFLAHKDFDKLDSNLYLWFNQLCIYKCEYLNEFFQVTQIPKYLYMQTFWDFDYYIFMYYLILYKGFAVHNMEVVAPAGALECEYFHPKNNSKKYSTLEVMVCHQALYEYLNREYIFVIHHLDRISSETFYASLDEIENSLPYRLGMLYETCCKKRLNYFSYLKLACKSLTLYKAQRPENKKVGGVIDYDTHTKIQNIKQSDIYKRGLSLESLCKKYTEKQCSNLRACIRMAYKLLKQRFQ